MKVVILAGGFGTRLSEYTNTVPKPMVKVKGKPLIYHIMKQYAKYGFKDFYIALGYKGKVIKNYFKNKPFNWNINLIDTGLHTMTGGRLKRLRKYLKDETFLMTYGDGVSNINIKKLINFHKKTGKKVTLTAVRPPARFGAIKITRNYVTYFREKSKLDEGWINGGYFVMHPSFLKYIKNDKTFLEKEPLEIACKKKHLAAYKHYGFWQCVDTKRDLDKLKKIYKIEKNKYFSRRYGFTGYHLIKKCIKKLKVTSISTRKPKPFRYVKRAKYVICDISNKKQLTKKINDKFDYVVNLGGYVDHSNKTKTYKSHYIGVKIYLKFFKQIFKIIYSNW